MVRVLVWTDMEGMSRVTDHRECWPVFPEYWSSGRRAFTDEVAAAASGLLEGGASQVFVVNGHGLGWPNLLWEELPEGVGPADDTARVEGFDAVFMLGFHARAGTADGYVSHTMVPGLRVAIDDVLVTESHIWAWLEGIPVLGIAGDAALEAQLDGILRDTSFLAVKHSASRTETVPAHAARSDSLDSIRAFSRQCVQAGNPRSLSVPSQFSFAVSMDTQLTDHAVDRHGLTRSSPGVLTVDCHDWGRDAHPALQAAMEAALRPLLEAQGDLDLSSETAMRQQEPAKLERFRDYFTQWVHASEPAWQR